MAARAAIHSPELGQHDLPNFDGQSPRIGLLFGCGGAGHFLFKVIALPGFPLAKLILVKRNGYQTGDQQAKRRKPGVQTFERVVQSQGPECSST
jgi:hypothetical protein